MNLYRAGSAISPLYESVRVGEDVILIDGKIKSREGGISVFSNIKGTSWTDNKTWVLPVGELVSGLEAINYVGTHWLITPSHDMTLDEYKLRLTNLNSKARLRKKLPATERVDSEAGRDVLAMGAPHTDYATRFLLRALDAVVEHTIPSPEWDENDYYLIQILAKELRAGRAPLSEHIWDPTGPHRGWSKERSFIAQAVIAYMAYEASKLKDRDDEDAEAEIANDHRFLRILLRLDNPANPFTEFEFETAAVP